MLAGLLGDFRYALRWLGRSPGFTAAALASLAIGIGFNASLFSLVDAVLFRPLPVESPATLVDVYTSGSDGDAYATSSYPDYLDLREQSPVFSDVAAHSAAFTALSAGDGRSRLALGEVVSGNFFPLLGLRARLGRTLLPEDDRPGALPVVMVSSRYWLRELGADPGAIGRTLRLRGTPYTIVGVAQEGYSGLLPMLASELWVPLSRVEDVEPAGIQDSVPSPTGRNRLERRGQRWLFLKGRLAPGASAEQARAQVALVMDRLRAAHPETNRDRRMTAVPSAGVRVHPAADRLLLPVGLALMALVGVVLLIACGNVASMLLARASARRREIGIRLAIGASRARLVRQLLAESLTLGLGGGLAGAALAFAVARGLTALRLPIAIPISFDVRVDGRVLAFTFLAALVAGVLAGLAPALRASRQDLASELRGGAPARAGGRRLELRDGLVAAQLALTLVLLVTAGLVSRSLSASRAADLGFRPQGLAVISTDPALAGYGRAEARAFWERALERLRSLPEAESVALASRLPFSINFHEEQIHVPGRTPPSEHGFTIDNTRVSADYFRTLGIALLQGRAFGPEDTPAAPGVAVVNETFARRFWPGESAVGKRVHTGSADGPGFEVVGVVADHRIRSVGEGRRAYIHFADSQSPGRSSTLVARGRGDAAALLAAMRRELLALEPNLVFLDNQTMQAQVAATLLPVHAGAWLASIVGAVALLLAAIGLYGVIAFNVARRTREIGVRMALGADRAGVVRLVLRKGLGLAAGGVAAGALLSVATLRALSGALYGVSAADPVVWSAAAGVLLLSALAANAVPAWRASRVLPSEALRVD
jgi:predicted permease